MSLLRFDEVSVEFGDLKILTGAEFSIETGERVCLIGRNGAGKSTTLKLIGGELEPDRGEIVCAHDLVTSQLAQTLPEAMNLPVRDVVRSGLSDVEALRRDVVDAGDDAQRGGVVQALDEAAIAAARAGAGRWRRTGRQ